MASLTREDRPRKPWRVDYVHNRRRRTERFKTKREAERFIGDLARGKSAAAERQTLDVWAVEWLRTHGPEWSPRTLRDRADYLDRLILPELGAARLGEIDRATVRQWRATLLRKGTTPHVVNRAVSVLSAALGAAVEDDLLTGNPCARLKRVPEATNRRMPATLDEIEAVRALMPDARGRAAVSLMAYAGLRPSELPTLDWSDVRAATIVVRSAAGGIGGRQVKGTKTGSTRVVPIIPAVRQDLDALAPSGPLVLGDEDGAPLDVRYWSARVWRPARKALASEATPYACRHAFASLLIAEGRTPHEVAGLLGHSTPALTLTTYGHLFAEAQLRPDESMADAVARARSDAAARAEASISLTA